VDAGLCSSTLIICHPNCVLTGSLISPTAIENAASEKGLTIASFLKAPSCPPLSLDGPSEKVFASSAKSSPDFAFSITSCAFIRASSVVFSSASSVTLKRMWRAETDASKLNSSWCSM